MRNSFDDVDFVVSAVEEFIELEIPDTVSVLSLLLGLQIVLKSYVDTVAQKIALPPAAVKLQSTVSRCIEEFNGALGQLDDEWNKRN